MRFNEAVMTDMLRRDLLAGAALAGGALAAANARAETGVAEIGSLKKETDVACVYHCDFGDAGRVGQMITNIDNHLSVYGYDPFKAKIVVVAHGQGVKPFLADFQGTPWASDAPDPSLYSRFEGLSRMGVEVFLCRITFSRNKMDPAKARAADFIRWVPSGVAALGELQAKGFGYIKVG